MEENNNSSEKTLIKEDYKPMCANHPFMKMIIIGLLIFLGSFCGFYVVADWHFKRMIPRMINNDFIRADKMMKKEMRDMDKMFRHGSNFSKNGANLIHMEQNESGYKISIDLKQFDNNVNNLQVLTHGNILTINGRTVKKSRNEEQISEFQQNYAFGDNVKLDELQKEKVDNFYVITIPVNSDKD